MMQTLVLIFSAMLLDWRRGPYDVLGLQSKLLARCERPSVQACERCP